MLQNKCTNNLLMTHVWILVIFYCRLYDKVNDTESAAAAFTEFCLREEDKNVKCFEDQTEFYNALQYLANYHLKKGELDDAYTYAYRCLEFEEVYIIWTISNFHYIEF